MCTELIKRGDICYVDFGDLQEGEITQKQKGIRPAVIISNEKANTYSTLLSVVPLSSKLKNMYLPVHVEIHNDKYTGLSAPSIALVEQIGPIDKKYILSKIGKIDQNTCFKIDKAILAQFGIYH